MCDVPHSPASIMKIHHRQQPLFPEATHDSHLVEGFFSFEESGHPQERMPTKIHAPAGYAGDPAAVRVEEDFTGDAVENSFLYKLRAKCRRLFLNSCVRSQHLLPSCRRKKAIAASGTSDCSFGSGPPPCRDKVMAPPFDSRIKENQCSVRNRSG